jgi:hypothetical protein
MFDLFGNGRTLAGVRRILAGVGGGLHKRVDDNRALSQLLWREAPHLLSRHPWVLQSLQDNESFLIELAQAMPAEERNEPASMPAEPMPHDGWADTQPLLDRFEQ